MDENPLPISPSALAADKAAEYDRKVVSDRGRSLAVSSVPKHNERRHNATMIGSIDQIEGLDARLRRMGTADDWGGSTYTFTACVDGTPKNFVIPIISGPTTP